VRAGGVRAGVRVRVREQRDQRSHHADTKHAGKPAASTRTRTATSSFTGTMTMTLR